jgi:hypothetical protein
VAGIYLSFPVATLLLLSYHQIISDHRIRLAEGVIEGHLIGGNVESNVMRLDTRGKSSTFGISIATGVPGETPRFLSAPT